MERRQADVGDFLLIEEGDLERRILPEYIGYRSGTRREKDAGGTSAGDPPVDAAKDIPAIPRRDTALLGRFPFEARLACAIAEFLLYFPRPNPRRTYCIYWHFFVTARFAVLHLLNVGQKLTGSLATKGCGHGSRAVAILVTPAISECFTDP